MFNIFRFYKSWLMPTFGDGDGGGEGGDGGAGGGDTTGGSGGDDRVATLEKTLEGVVGVVQTLATGHAGLQQSLTTLNETLANMGKQTHSDEDDNTSVDDVDLETMSRKDLISLINSNTEKLLTKSLKGVDEKLGALGGKLDENISAYTVKEFQKGHPDLMEWKDEIRGILQGGRANNVEDAYKLVRVDNPDKAKKMDTKYNPPSKKDDGEKFHVFTGFPPGGSAGGGKGNTRMTPKIAAESAWDEAIAAMPGVEQFLSNDVVTH